MGIYWHLHGYGRFLPFPSIAKQKFVMNVLFDSIALHYVHRLGRLRLEKASWGSLPKETSKKM